MYTFLAALPAILGILGFVIFLLLRSRGSGDPLTLRIIEKLRAEHPERFTGTSLTQRQVHSLLSRDQDLQREVGNQDFQLLGQALRQQHVQAIFIYGICAVVFVVGVILFVYQVNRPEPTKISGIQLEDTRPEAGGALVDLDALQMSWQSSGTPADVTLYAENIDTGVRTSPVNARSPDGRAPLSRDGYAPILVNRTFGATNRMRIVIQAEAGAFHSKEFAVHVGLTVLAVAFDEKVKIAAMIDNRVVDGYAFEAKLVVPERDSLEFLSLGGSITAAQDYPVADTSKYDWDAAKLAYLGPDDRRLVRYEVVHD